MNTNQSNGNIENESQLSSSLMDAMASGKFEEVDRLMAVELPPAPEPETPEEQDVTPDEPPVEGEEQKVEDGSTPVDNDSAPPETPPETPPAPAATAAEAQEIDNLRRELHRYKSDAGRVPYLQRELQELKRKVQSPATKADQSAEESNDSIKLPANLQKKIDELREIDPAMAEIQESMFKENIRLSQETQRASQESQRKAEEQREDEAFIDQQFNELIRQIPQAPEVFKMPEWQTWKKSLSPGRRALAESIYADEVAEAIRAFAAVMQSRQQTTAPPVPAAPPVATQAQVQVQETRDRKMNTAAQVKTVAAKQRQPLDVDAQFQAFYEQLGKENHILK